MLIGLFFSEDQARRQQVKSFNHFDSQALPWRITIYLHTFRDGKRPIYERQSGDDGSVTLTAICGEGWEGGCHCRPQDERVPPEEIAGMARQAFGRCGC